MWRDFWCGKAGLAARCSSAWTVGRACAPKAPPLSGVRTLAQGGGFSIGQSVRIKKAQAHRPQRNLRARSARYGNNMEIARRARALSMGVLGAQVAPSEAAGGGLGGGELGGAQV